MKRGRDEPKGEETGKHADVTTRQLGVAVARQRAARVAERQETRQARAESSKSCREARDSSKLVEKMMNSS